MTDKRVERERRGKGTSAQTTTSWTKPRSRYVIEATEIFKHLVAKLHIVTGLATKELYLLSLKPSSLLFLNTVLFLPCRVAIMPEFGWNIGATMRGGIGCRGRDDESEWWTSFRRSGGFRNDELIKRMGTRQIPVSGIGFMLSCASSAPAVVFVSHFWQEQGMANQERL
jgi:hypothetical protein